MNSVNIIRPANISKIMCSSIMIFNCKYRVSLSCLLILPKDLFDPGVIHITHVSILALNLKGSSPSVFPGAPKSGNADCTMTMSDQTFVELSSGKLTGQKVIQQIICTF